MCACKLHIVLSYHSSFLFDSYLPPVAQRWDSPELPSGSRTWGGEGRNREECAAVLGEEVEGTTWQMGTSAIIVQTEVKEHQESGVEDTVYVTKKFEEVCTIFVRSIQIDGPVLALIMVTGDIQPWLQTPDRTWRPASSAACAMQKPRRRDCKRNRIEILLTVRVLAYVLPF